MKISYNDFVLIFGKINNKINVNNFIHRSVGGNIAPDLCIMDAYRDGQTHKTINTMLEDFFLEIDPEIPYLKFVRCERLKIIHDVNLLNDNSNIIHENFINLKMLYNKMIKLGRIETDIDKISQISSDFSLTKNEFFKILTPLIVNSDKIKLRDNCFYLSDNVESLMDNFAHRFMCSIIENNYLTDPMAKQNINYITNWIQKTRRDLYGIHGIFSVCEPFEDGWKVTPDVLYYGFLDRTNMRLPGINWSPELK